jgi:hypothetical protein
VVPDCNRGLLAFSDESVDKWRGLPRYQDNAEQQKVDVAVTKSADVPFFFDIKETD